MESLCLVVLGGVTKPAGSCWPLQGPIILPYYDFLLHEETHTHQVDPFQRRFEVFSLMRRSFFRHVEQNKSKVEEQKKEVGGCSIARDVSGWKLVLFHRGLESDLDLRIRIP